ncbi:hypothetical protein I315_01862 [Cryptococcus gattii Ru294]|nr:hypothetical protein I315_01862 [Cryptococcus gattii Ru294]
MPSSTLTKEEILLSVPQQKTPTYAAIITEGLVGPSTSNLCSGTKALSMARYDYHLENGSPEHTDDVAFGGEDDGDSQDDDEDDDRDAREDIEREEDDSEHGGRDREEQALEEHRRMERRAKEEEMECRRKEVSAKAEEMECRRKEVSAKEEESIHSSILRISQFVLPCVSGDPVEAYKKAVTMYESQRRQGGEDNNS